LLIWIVNCLFVKLKRY